MHKNKIFSSALFVIICFLCLSAFAQQQENVTITTYYPSPYGSYNELRAKRVAIGDNYINSNSYPVPANTSLIVEGTVGIGTGSNAPIAKVEVVDSSFQSRPGLRVQSSPNAGYSTAEFIHNHAPGDDRYVLFAGRQGSFPDQDFVVSTRGNVGIGNTGPAAKLEVTAVNNSVAIGGRLAGGQATGLQFLNYGTQHAGLRWSNDGSHRLVLEDASYSNNPATWNNSSNGVNFQVRNGGVTWGGTHSVGVLSADQGSSIELGGALPNGAWTASPYIDFHNNDSPLVDYDSRIIAYTSSNSIPIHRLQIASGLVEVTPRPSGGGSAFRFPVSSSPPFPCTIDKLGAVYYDDTEFDMGNLAYKYGVLCVCSSSWWFGSFNWEKMSTGYNHTGTCS